MKKTLAFATSAMILTACSHSQSQGEMKEEMNWMKHYFEKNFKFEDIKPKLIFIIFPIENIEALRGNEGFYAGLC